MSQATKRRRVSDADFPQPDPGPQRTNAVRWGIALGIGALFALGGIAWYTGVFGGSEGDPDVAAPIADGSNFAFVTVSSDATGQVTLGIDQAEMLSGEEARAAALEDGVIGDGEDLPNDFYIRNSEIAYEQMAFSESAQVNVVSSADPGTTLAITPGALLEVYSGQKVDDAIYGIVAGQPIAMNLTITDGAVTKADAVYLP